MLETSWQSLKSANHVIFKSEILVWRVDLWVLRRLHIRSRQNHQSFDPNGSNQCIQGSRDQRFLAHWKTELSLASVEVPQWNIQTDPNTTVEGPKLDLGFACIWAFRFPMIFLVVVLSPLGEASIFSACSFHFRIFVFLVHSISLFLSVLGWIFAGYSESLSVFAAFSMHLFSCVFLILVASPLNFEGVFRFCSRFWVSYNCWPCCHAFLFLHFENWNGGRDPLGPFGIQTFLCLVAW